MYKRSGDIIKSKISEYLIPGILMNIALYIVSFIDSSLVSHFLSAEYMAAYNVAMPLTDLFFALPLIFGFGGSLVVSYVKADQDNKKANEIFTLSIVLLLSASIIFSLICLININTLLSILAKNPQMIILIKNYVFILLMGLPLILTLYGLCYFINIDGFPKFTTFIFGVVGVVNIITLIISLNFFNMGVEAVAIANILGYAFTIPFIFIRYMRSKQRSLFFKPIKKSMFKFKDIKKIVSYGSVNSLNTFYSFIKST